MIVDTTVLMTLDNDTLATGRLISNSLLWLRLSP